MSEVKIVKGVIPCTQAEEDTRVVVDAAFSVLVPKGMMFSTDQAEIGEDELLAMFAPVPDSAKLEDDSFSMQYGNSQTRVRFNAEVHDFGGTMDLTDDNARKKLEDIFVGVLQKATGLLGDLLGSNSSALPFVVKSDEKAIVVAATQGILGNASFIFALPFGYYTGMYRVVKGTGQEQAMEIAIPEDYKETAKTLLSTIEVFEDPSAITSKDGESAPLLVSELSYTQKRRVEVGAISVPIPDGTKCALSEAIDKVDTVIPRNLRNNMDFICVPEAYTRGFGAYQDASISIFIGKPTLINNLEQGWNSNSVDDVTSQLLGQFEGSLNKQAMTKSLKVVHKEKGFMSCYCLFSGDNAQEGFWRSYAFYIVTGSTFVTGMFYFNQKAAESEFEALVKHWLSEVRRVDGVATKRITSTLKEEHLGPYAAENGKPDAILIARLFAEDVLFFPETPFEREGNKLTLNPQFNAVKQEQHPFIMQNRQAFFSALGDLFIQLDANKELQLPKSKIHQKMLRPLLDDRLTGLSFLNLMAYHMVKIVEKDDAKDTYMVIVDQNVIAGIPDAYHYICKFIKFAREYNEKAGAYAVQFSSAINFDSPISGKLTPVAGAAVGQAAAGMCGFTVQEDGTITDGNTFQVSESERRTADASALGERDHDDRPTPKGTKPLKDEGTRQNEERKRVEAEKAEEEEKNYLRIIEERERRVQTEVEQETLKREQAHYEQRDALRQEHDVAQAKMKETVRKMREEMEQNQARIKTLGFFRGREKRQLGEKCDQLQKNIKHAENQMEVDQKTFTSKMARLKEKQRKEIEQLSEEIGRKYPMPVEPDSLVRKREEAERKEREEREKAEKKEQELKREAEEKKKNQEKMMLKERILEFISIQDYGATTKQVKNGIPELWSKSQLDTSTLLHELSRERRISLRESVQGMRWFLRDE